MQNEQGLPNTPYLHHPPKRGVLPPPSSLPYSIVPKKDQQPIIAKRQAIVEANKIVAQKAKAKLEALSFDYKRLQQEIIARKEILNIETQLFEIDSQQYQDLEMAPSDFLKAKKAFLEKQQAFQRSLIQLEQLEQSILFYCIGRPPQDTFTCGYESLLH